MFEPSEYVRDLAQLAGGSRLAVSTNHRLLVVDPSVTPARIVSETKLEHWALRAVADGRGLLARKREGDTIYAFANDQLRRIGATTVDLDFAFEREGRLFYGPEKFRFELVGFAAALASAIDALDSKPKPKPKKPGKTPAKKGTAPTLESVADPSPAVLAALSLEGTERERANPKARLAELPDATFAISRRAGKHNRSLTHVAADGRKTDLSKPIADQLNETILGVYLPPSGDYVFVWTHNRLLRVQVDPIAVELVVDNADLSRRICNPQAPADDLLVYVDRKQVRWVRRDAAGVWTEIAAGKAPSATWVLAASEELAIVYAKDNLEHKSPKYPLRVWRLGGKGVAQAAKEIAKFERLAVRAAHEDGRWYVRDDRGDVFELLGC